MLKWKTQLIKYGIQFSIIYRGLADMNGDGQMDINEYSIACKLITNKLQGMNRFDIKLHVLLLILLICNLEICETISDVRYHVLSLKALKYPKRFLLPY